MGKALGLAPRLLWAWRGNGRKGRGHSRCQVRASYVLLSVASSGGEGASRCSVPQFPHSPHCYELEPREAVTCVLVRVSQVHPCRGVQVPAPAPTWWWLAGHCLGSWASCPVHSRQQLLTAPARAWGRPTDCEPMSPHKLQMDPAPRGWLPDRYPGG